METPSLEIDTRVEIYPLRPKHSHSPSKGPKLSKAPPHSSTKALPKLPSPQKPLISKPKSPAKPVSPQKHLVPREVQVTSDSRDKRAVKSTKKQAMIEALKRVATVKALEEAFRSKRIK